MKQLKQIYFYLLINFIKYNLKDDQKPLNIFRERINKYEVIELI